ncbi:thioesterase II family protein [Streptomyces triticagri]|uniref:thioesterase II family protein n=1 Tax=Streptomyces triticagri TaxID=2293568 RepID=UPI001314E2C8|nr:alpha/beta fold hydrolase [Streptomyces triticagri]
MYDSASPQAVLDDHSPAGGWLRRWRTPGDGPPRRRLLCLPPAGGAAHLYADWARVLGHTTEVAAVELPGRGARGGEPPLNRMADIVTGVESALDTLPELPLVVFGHSMGAVVGWELCRSLRHRRDVLVRGMVAAATPAPHLPPPRRWQAGSDTRDEDLLRLLDHSQSLPPELRGNAEFLRLYLPVLRADVEVLARHRPRRERPMPCALSIYVGAGDPLVTEQDAWPWAPGEVSGERALHVFPGGHFFPHEHPGPVLRRLARDLDTMTAP